MRFRLPMLLALLGLLACPVHSLAQSPAQSAAQSTPQATTQATSQATTQATTQTRTAGAQALLDEGQRQLAALRETSYQVRTEVDEAAGSYHYDCTGFLTYSLRRAAPRALAVVPVPPGRRHPRAETFWTVFEGLTGAPDEAWERIPSVQGLAPGDVVAWLKDPESDTRASGHVVLVLAAPQPNPRRPGEWLVRVLDSCENPHAADTRVKGGPGGLGAGVIGLLVDEAGRPWGYRWRGGESKRDVRTRVNMARVRGE